MPKSNAKPPTNRPRTIAGETRFFRGSSRLWRERPRSSRRRRDRGRSSSMSLSRMVGGEKRGGVKVIVGTANCGGFSLRRSSAQQPLERLPNAPRVGRQLVQEKLGRREAHPPCELLQFRGHFGILVQRAVGDDPQPGLGETEERVTGRWHC